MLPVPSTPSPSQANRLRGLAIWAVLCAVGITLHETAVLSTIEYARTALWHRVAGVRTQPQHVAIVGIDESSLQERPGEPLVFWTPHFATALSVMHKVGVKAIGVDILMTVSPEAWLAKSGLTTDDKAREFDRPFRSALGEGLTALTAFMTDENSDELLLPNRDYWMSLPEMVEQVALANLDYHASGTVRTYRLASKRQDAPRVMLGPLLAAQAAGIDLAAATWQLGGRTLDVAAHNEGIAFCGPPGTVPVVPISKLLAKGAANDPAVKSLRGKVVLLAATYHAAQDVHPTPYSPILMNGAEIHAQIAEALLTGRRLTPPPTWLMWLMLALVAALASNFVLRRVPIVRGGVYVLLGCALVATVSFAAWLLDVVLPIGAFSATIACGYVGALGLGLRGSERRRAELKKMFGKYVSDEVVEHLLAGGAEPHLGGTTREVTVLFCDIRNFTTLSERLEAPMVVEMLNGWFTAVSGPILDNGGTIDKYIGDAVMAVFGSPVAHPDHARRALRAAAEMAEQAELFKQWMQQRFPDKDLPEFGIGVGLHSGSAVSGNIGSAQRMEFTTIGDTVNAASRLEGLTKVMGATVVVSRQVLDAAGDVVTVGAPQSMQVKGREEPIDVFPFIGMKDEVRP